VTSHVLVTGGTSLIGRTVALGLNERGHTVSTFQRRPSGLPFAEHRGDLADRTALDRAMEGIDAVVHLAARVGVVGTGDQFEQTNVVGTANVLAAARAGGVRRFVHISSPSVAHSGRSLVGAPAGPADPDAARGHYARSKARAEVVALAASSEEFPVAVIRPHLVWGPGDTQLVGRIVERARQGRLAIVGSGTALIDTIYLDNAADAIIAAVERAPEIAGRPLVVSNGEPRPLRDLVGRIVAAAGLEPPSLRVPYRLAYAGGLVVERLWERTGRAGDPPMTSFLAEQLATAHWFDQRETRRSLDWIPHVGLDEGFERLRAWYAAQIDEGSV
jgi:nucleoside-diphosphate-sugar epimerase